MVQSLPSAGLPNVNYWLIKPFTDVIYYHSDPSHKGFESFILYKQQKKRVVVQNKSHLLLKIILYDTLTLQLFTIETKL